MVSSKKDHGNKTKLVQVNLRHLQENEFCRLFGKFSSIHLGFLYRFASLFVKLTPETVFYK